jgi:hypothetical protein
MDDAISRQAAINAVLRAEALVRAYGYRYAADALRELPAAQPDLTYIIFETLAECGIYGEEATIKLIGTLKRRGRGASGQMTTLVHSADFSRGTREIYIRCHIARTAEQI